MTARYAITTIIACTLSIALVGISVGYGVGTFAPGYYRSVFRHGREPGFDPVSLGVGLGFSQGAVGGVLVGLAVVALFCWREIRLHPKSSPAATMESEVVSSTSTAWSLLVVTGSVLALAFCVFFGIVVGLIVGESTTYHRRYLEEEQSLAPVLASDKAFAGIKVHERSDGGVLLFGNVPARADLDRLSTLVIRTIGEARAKDALRGVDVRQ